MDSGETAWLLICREWAFLSQKEYEISGLHGVACRPGNVIMTLWGIWYASVLLIKLQKKKLVMVADVNGFN